MSNYNNNRRNEPDAIESMWSLLFTIFILLWPVWVFMGIPLLFIIFWR